MGIYVNIVGAHATRDAKPINVAEGKSAMTVLGIAVDVTGKDKSKPETQFLDLVCFGVNAERAAHIKSGASVTVAGDLVVEPWVRADGSVEKKPKVLVSAINWVAKQQA